MSAHADMPPPVTGIQALQEPTGVRVMWDAVNDSDVVRYHVYFSRESILENGGQFEDFEVTKDATPEYFLHTIPSGSMLFVSVVAENADGQDSGGFVEEASVFLLPIDTANPYIKKEHTMEHKEEPTEQPKEEEMESPDETATPVDVPEEDEPVVAVTTGIPSALRLLTTVAASPTELLLAFSHNVTLPEDANVPLLFSIRDGDGNELEVQEFDIDGPLLTLYTSIQKGGTVYEVQVSDLVQGQLGDVQFPLDPATSTALVMGKIEPQEAFPVEPGEEEPMTPAEPTEPEETAEPVEPTKPVPIEPIVSTYRLNESDTEARELTLTAHPYGDTYLVDVTWAHPMNNPEFWSYRLSQSQNNGQSYIVTQAFHGNVHTARIHGVPPGSFGVLLQSVGRGGTATAGVFTSVELPSLSTPLTASALPIEAMTLRVQPVSAPANTSNLAQTGLGGGALAIAIGGAAGVAILRRRKRSTK